MTQEIITIMINTFEVEKNSYLIQENLQLLHCRQSVVANGHFFDTRINAGSFAVISILLESLILIM